ncbi:MAG: ribosome maturation factor RimM [Chloroflexota bacterium]|nr:ribosome maturation factor RimM [Chloroflexota bacterium]
MPPSSEERPQQPERLAAARILGPWGRHGHLRIASLSDVPDRFANGARFLIGDDPYVSEGSWQQGKFLLIKLRGIDTRWDAEPLRGALLETPMEEAAALPEGEYYQHQVLGLAVRTTDGRDLGALADIIETGSNDVYVVRGPDGEVLIPAIPDIVRDVDMANGVITIETVPGLL